MYFLKFYGKQFKKHSQRNKGQHFRQRRTVIIKFSLKGQSHSNSRGSFFFLRECISNRSFFHAPKARNWMESEKERFSRKERKNEKWQEKSSQTEEIKQRVSGLFYLKQAGNRNQQYL
ncbi:hypothetical protein [Sabulibacter ruber]|uniref:hypothetical protein n=1 Tax=Sabulibacter ruber TaxID=2811901 RepID=UPI001A977168|nr:hypothetical protein [Sabulibacter ruber]